MKKVILDGFVFNNGLDGFGLALISDGKKVTVLSTNKNIEKSISETIKSSEYIKKNMNNKEFDPCSYIAGNMSRFIFNELPYNVTNLTKVQKSMAAS